MVVGPIRESYATDLNDTKSEENVVKTTEEKQEKTEGRFHSNMIMLLFMQQTKKSLKPQEIL